MKAAQTISDTIFLRSTLAAFVLMYLQEKHQEALRLLYLPLGALKAP